MRRPSRTLPAADPRQRLGLAGEQGVMAWLAGRGWRIEAHRLRMGRLEIDLVIRRGSLVAFVEVKTRRGRGYGGGRAAVGWKKQQAIARAAEAWRLRHGRPGDTYRFDVVEVVLAGGSRVDRVEHIADAWRICR